MRRDDQDFLFDDEMVEALAAYAHEAWAGWMQYLFGLAHSDGKGGKVIPAPQVQRWLRQMNSHYTELPEEEKDSDRLEAAKIVDIITARDV